MAIKPLLAGVLEAALNQYLSLDPDSHFFLEPLAGKVIAVTILPCGRIHSVPGSLRRRTRHPNDRLDMGIGPDGAQLETDAFHFLRRGEN
jgi:hypothetical protein